MKIFSSNFLGGDSPLRGQWNGLTMIMLHLRDIFLAEKTTNKEKEVKKKKDKKHMQLEAKYTVYGLAHALQYRSYEAIPQIGKDFATYDGPNVLKMLS